MISIIKRHLTENFPFLTGSKLLLAISGGIDSVVLGHILKKLGYNFGMAHVNFQLRAAESDADEAFVKELGAAWQVAVFTKSFDTALIASKSKLSIQMAARDIRYRWFEKLMQEQGFDYLLTAHQLDDHIETFFINLNRKSGIEGLTGIPEQNGNIIRPLLPFSRVEIAQYAEEQGLTWREDQSNAALKYERNKIRHLLMPVLAQINPNFRTDFAESLKYLKQNRTLAADYLEHIKPLFVKQKQDQLLIDLIALQQLPHFDNILYEVLKPYGFTDWQAITELIYAQSGKKILSEGHLLLKHRNQFIVSELTPTEQDKKRIEVADRIETGSHLYRLATISFDPSINFKKKGIEYLDADKISFPLYIRKWKSGDYFFPLGMKGTKKLSDYFTDLKLSTLEKEKIWLLCDAQDQIIWVIGYRIDDRFKVVKTTQQLLKIQPEPI